MKIKKPLTLTQVTSPSVETKPDDLAVRRSEVEAFKKVSAKDKKNHTGANIQDSAQTQATKRKSARNALSEPLAVNSEDMKLLYEKPPSELLIMLYSATADLTKLNNKYSNEPIMSALSLLRKEIKLRRELLVKANGLIGR